MTASGRGPAAEATGRMPPSVRVRERALYATVFCFAAWVAAWGLLLPARVDSALPFAVPPLHSRFLGVVYLSGCTFMLLGVGARRWTDVRVMTAMLAIWTGMLSVVSLLHLDAFSWSRPQTWFWFGAYICFPLIASWLIWQRRENANVGTGTDAAPPSRVRAYLCVQGWVAAMLGLCLLIAPSPISRVWPWAISPLLAQIYSAPFLSFGIGSILAARQPSWNNIRIVVGGTLVFSLGALAVSVIHRDLFDLRTAAAWLWFGGFGLASASLLLFLAWSLPRTRRRSAAMPD